MIRDQQKPMQAEANTIHKSDIVHRSGQIIDQVTVITSLYNRAKFTSTIDRGVVACACNLAVEVTNWFIRGRRFDTESRLSYDDV